MGMIYRSRGRKGGITFKIYLSISMLLTLDLATLSQTMGIFVILMLMWCSTFYFHYSEQVELFELTSTGIVCKEWWCSTTGC